MKTYNKTNFHKHTFCLFTEVSVAEISDLKLNYISKSGSEYCFTEEGVYRKSNHWGRAANCKWRLESKNFEQNSRIKVGFAKWTAFHSINETEKLYFIEVDFEKNTAQYFHKNTATHQNLYLRTATETTKRLKEIRHLLINSKKLKHWDIDIEFEALLKKVIHELTTTDDPLLQIKRKMLALEI